MRKIMRWMSINGREVLQEDANISALDYGILYGYGVFTTLKVRDGVSLFFERHRQRLQMSVERLAFGRFSLSFDLKAAINNVIHLNELVEGALRITITPGIPLQSPFFGNINPTVVIHATLMHEPREFVDAITIEEQRDIFRDIKMTNRVVSLLAERTALQQGVQEALFSDKEGLVEATSSNIFSLDSTGRLVTPPIEGRGLNGITRQILLECAETQIAQIPTNTTGPLFLINSLSAVPIRCLDGRELIQQRDLLLSIRRKIAMREDEDLKTMKNL